MKLLLITPFAAALSFALPASAQTPSAQPATEPKGPKLIIEDTSLIIPDTWERLVPRLSPWPKHRRTPRSYGGWIPPGDYLVGVRLKSYRQWELETDTSTPVINDGKRVPLFFRLAVPSGGQAAPVIYSKRLHPSIEMPYEGFALQSARDPLTNTERFRRRAEFYTGSGGFKRGMLSISRIYNLLF